MTFHHPSSPSGFHADDTDKRVDTSETMSTRQLYKRGDTLLFVRYQMFLDKQHRKPQGRRSYQHINSIFQTLT